MTRPPGELRSPSALPADPAVPAPQLRGRALRRLMACVGPANLGIALVWGAVPGTLLALQVQRAVGEESKVGGLALITTAGALVAMVAQPVAGAVSDRTRSRFGRRSPWIVAGVATGGLALIGMAFTRSVPGMLALWCLVQIGFNFAMGPLSAVMPDRVPPEKRGLFSTVVGLGSMCGSLLGQIFAAAFEDRITTAYVALATVATTLAVVCVTLNPDRPSRDAPQETFQVHEFLRELLPNPRKHPDFFWVFVSRLCTNLSYFLVFGYKLYILQDYIGLHDEAIDHIPALALTAVAGLLPAAAISGPLSDRLGRRKVFVVASASLLGCAMLIPFAVPTMTGMTVMALLVGIGFGCFQGVDTALISQVLPSERSFARDLGVVNIASTLPQVLAPAIAGAVVLWLGGYGTLFPLAMAFALLGAVSVLRVQGVR